MVASKLDQRQACMVLASVVVRLQKEVIMPKYISMVHCEDCIFSYLHEGQRQTVAHQFWILSNPITRPEPTPAMENYVQLKCGLNPKHIDVETLHFCGQGKDSTI